MGRIAALKRYGSKFKSSMRRKKYPGHHSSFGGTTGKAYHNAKYRTKQTFKRRYNPDKFRRYMSKYK